jgi:hypothetical protein
MSSHSSRLAGLPLAAAVVTVGVVVVLLLVLGALRPAPAAPALTPSIPIASPTPATPTLSPSPVAPTGAASTPRPPDVTSAPTPWANVSAQAAGLRLRQSPGTAGEVIRELPVATTLALVGRTADNAWVQGVTAAGEKGWVAAAYVDLHGDLAQLPVTGKVANAGGAVPYISGITAHARAIFLAGQALGNHADAFSLVGDSNTDNPAFLAPFDQGNYDLGPYADLQSTIDYFKGSFARHSPAAVGGFSTAKVLDPANAGGGCSGGESPLACEYRLQKPSVALILLGTGDQHAWKDFEGRYRQIIECTVKQGIVPVLITKADNLESTDNTAPVGFINAVIVRLSQEYDVPLLNLRQAVDPLPNRGLKTDGFHYNTPPDGQSANFTGDHMSYGFNMRNLTALQVLDALRRYVLY